MTEMVKRRINKGKSKKAQPRGGRIPENIMKLLQAMGRISMPSLRISRYTRNQGPRECARRVRQMQRIASKSKPTAI